MSLPTIGTLVIACFFFHDAATLTNDTSVSPFLADGMGNVYTAFEGNGFFSLDDGSSANLALCGVRWTDQDAAVFCRQKGRQLYRTYTNSFFGAHNPSSADVLVVTFPVDFVCDGTETSLLDCPAKSTNKKGQCYDGNDASLACLFREEPADFAVRLAGSSDINAGRVEVKHQGTWGSVEAIVVERKREYGDVVCRMLDLGFATEVTPHRDEFGESTLPVVVGGVACTGAEPSLAQCGENLEFVNDVFQNMTRDDTVVHCSGQMEKMVPSL
ncbi:deleted in malignant brain tumors 1 protein-like [Patiria miniata]|uniref:SRCR domain-containing protein n=1 Tax=Patiria miniata TaxID=46514 RepID=A0A913ZQB1_PATMI|nr:deleted in malignant brain tumors 1 protein-like [Patiria miniata]